MISFTAKARESTGISHLPTAPHMHNLSSRQHLPPFFYFPDDILWSMKVFNFDEAQFIFSFVICLFNGMHKKTQKFTEIYSYDL